ncbi:MAG: CD1247 N-terminal domain-containing protein [Christensenellales bacterium]|jgi:phage FluMu protein Com
MESIRKKAGYLEGLVSAMKLDDSDPKDQLIGGIVSLLSDLADRTEALDDLLGELNDYVESIDDDLSELEGIHDDDDAADFDEDGFDGFPGEEPLRLIKNPADAPKKVRVPALCPSCGKVFLASGALDGAKYECPACKTIVAPRRLSDANTPVADPVGD